jgi:hypothetical protein
MEGTGSATSITVVSGLPRSGTSMMMAMLSAGGLEVLTDGVRFADESNPQGYFEYEPTKALRNGEAAWLSLAEGKAVKIVSPLLRYLPAQHHFKVIFMLRSIDEILASQGRMLERTGQETTADADAKLVASYTRHLAEVRNWLAGRPNFDALWVAHREVIEDPIGAARSISRFLGRPLDDAAMARAIDRSLYRQRLNSQ